MFVFVFKFRGEQRGRGKSIEKGRSAMDDAVKSFGEVANWEKGQA